jgi:hypothetical protein
VPLSRARRRSRNWRPILPKHCTLISIAALIGAITVVVPRAHASVSLEAGRLIFGPENEDASPFTVGLRGGPARAHDYGIDFGVSVIPEWSAAGFTIATVDLGLAYALPVGAMSVVPRVGVSALTIFASDAGGLVGGWHAGAGLVVPLGESFAVRGDYLYRSLKSGGSDPFPLSSATVGVVWLGKASK